jgi:hypothetical protein
MGPRVLLPCLALTVACTSSSGGTTTSSSGDGGAPPPNGTCSTAIYDGGIPCASRFPLQGGLSTTVAATGCGSENAATVLDWGNFDASHGTGAGVSFHLTRVLLPGQTGPLAVDTVTVRELVGDAGIVSWTTPAGACTVTIETNVCMRNRDGKAYDLYFTGSGTCTQPAAPQPGNTKAPVTIGDFTFQGYAPCVKENGFNC